MSYQSGTSSNLSSPPREGSGNGTNSTQSTYPSRLSGGGKSPVYRSNITQPTQPSHISGSNRTVIGGTNACLGRPLIRRIAPGCATDRIIRVIEGTGNNRGFNQQMPCFPPPPPSFFAPPPPPPPGFYPPFLFPPGVSPCQKINQLQNTSIIRKPCCEIPKLHDKPHHDPQQQTPHFNNCNFYLSDPFQNILPSYLAPGLRHNPFASNAPYFPSNQETNQAVPCKDKLPEKLLRNKCELLSESDGCSVMSRRDRHNKIWKPRKSSQVRHSNKPYKVSRQCTTKTSSYLAQNSRYKTVSSCRSCSPECSGIDTLKNPCRNQTIRIQPIEDPVPPTLPPPPKSRHSCCKTSNGLKLNPSCQKCIERYIEKQVALRLQKKCCCSTTPKLNSCPHPASKSCREEQCGTDFSIVINPVSSRYIRHTTTLQSLREGPSCTDFESEILTVHTTKSQATVVIDNSGSIVSIIAETAERSTTSVCCPSNIKSAIAVFVKPNPSRKLQSICPSKSQISVLYESNLQSRCNMARDCPSEASNQNENSRIAVILESNPSSMCATACPLYRKSQIAIAVESTMNRTLATGQKSQIAVVVESNPMSRCKLANPCTSTFNSKMAVVVVESQQTSARACGLPPDHKSEIAISLLSQRAPKMTSFCTSNLISRVAVLADSKTCMNGDPPCLIQGPSKSLIVSISTTALAADNCCDVNTVPSFATLDIFGPKLVHNVCSHVIEFPHQDSFGVTVSMPDLTLSHRSCVEASTTNLVLLQSQVEMRQVKSTIHFQGPSHHVTLQTQNTCPITQPTPCLPRRPKQHRIVKPSYSQIRGITVKKTSDKCVRRQHITVFKEHVPHETIQNSEVSCTYEEAPFAFPYNYTTAFAAVASNIQYHHQPANPPNVAINVVHESQTFPPPLVSNVQNPCKRPVNAPSVVVAVSSQGPSKTLISGMTGSNTGTKTQIMYETPITDYETGLESRSRDGTLKTHIIQNQDNVKSWHWNAADPITNGTVSIVHIWWRESYLCPGKYRKTPQDAEQNDVYGNRTIPLEM